MVELFSNTGDQGLIYEGATVADLAGDFTFAKKLSRPNVTATATDEAGNTSPFSLPHAVFWNWDYNFVPIIYQRYP
jgi:hypothetical protein